jgi:small subunit ribosomal protein S9
MVKKTTAKRTEQADSDKKSARYFEAKGARKTAVARVRLSPKDGGIKVNGKDYKEYFRDPNLQREVLMPLEAMGVQDKLGVSAMVKGGGVTGQAEAVRHGISRALVIFNSDFRKKLRRQGFLTRDARMVERKKYGLRKARRAPQWAKR